MRSPGRGGASPSPRASVSGCVLDVVRKFFSSVCSLFLLSCHQICPVYCHLPTIRASKVCPLGAREPGVRTHLKIVRTCTERAGNHKNRQTRIWQSSKNEMAWHLTSKINKSREPEEMVRPAVKIVSMSLGNWFDLQRTRPNEAVENIVLNNNILLSQNNLSY